MLTLLEDFEMSVDVFDELTPTLEWLLRCKHPDKKDGYDKDWYPDDSKNKEFFLPVCGVCPLDKYEVCD